MPQPMTLKLAKLITGHISGLGVPSKMPGFSTALSAYTCITGKKLSEIEGTACSFCYAMGRGRYGAPDVQKGHARRFAALGHPLWVAGMVRLVGHYTDPADPFFRIHDSGDFQSAEHVIRWVEIARQLPWVQFWAPTQERRFVATARFTVGVANWPTNLTIRLSSIMVGQPPKRSSLPTSTIRSGVGFACRAYDTKPASCDSPDSKCRACWDPSVCNIDYRQQ